MVMMRFGWIGVGLGVAIASLTACSSIPLLDRWMPPDAVPSEPTEPTDDNPVDSLAADQDLPETRLTVVQRNGQPVEVELQLFDQDAFPLVFYTPADRFLGETKAGTDGISAYLRYVASEDAEPGAEANSASSAYPADSETYLRIFVPATPQSSDQLIQGVLGETGLLATEGWQMVDRTRVLTYSWAIERIDFRHEMGEEQYQGSIFIGDRDGQPFYAVTHYNQDLSNGFLMNVAMVLETIDRRPTQTDLTSRR